MRINRENAIAIVIDFQEKLIPSIQNVEHLIRNAVMLINGLKILDIPILVTQQNTSGLGTTVPKIANAIGELNFYEKLTFSCLQEPGFKKELELTGKKHVILIGLEAHICILQTSLDLLYNNYKPLIVEDCIGSSSENDKRVALWRIRDEGGMITTAESLLFELCIVAGTSEFKKILTRIKERNNA